MRTLVQLGTLAALSVRELVRRRLLYVLVVFGAGMILLSLPLVQLSVGQWRRLIVDVGLGTANVVLDLLAAVLGASLIAGDVERRSIYVVIARPIPRWVIVLGRFLGLAVVLAGLLVAMAVGVTVALRIVRAEPGLGLYQAWLGLGLEATVVVSIALVFSSFSSSLLSGLFAISLAVLGHLVSDLSFFSNRAHAPVSRWVGNAVARALPNLEQFNFKAVASYNEVLARSAVTSACWAAFAYVALFVWLASVIFSRTDLK